MSKQLHTYTFISIISFVYFIFRHLGAVKHSKVWNIVKVKNLLP